MKRSTWGIVAVAATVALSLVAPVGAAARYDFEPATEGSGIHKAGGVSWGSVWEDYDRDGDADLFVNRHYMRPRLFVNQGGAYVEHPEDFLSPPGYSSPDDGPMDRHACAWGEANGDRVPELLCTQGADKAIGTGPNQLLFRRGAGFVDRASGWRVAQTYSRGRTVNWLDFDSDGDLDLFFGNAYRSGYPNKLFRNDRGAFHRVRNPRLELSGPTVASTWSDWDNDGDPDLLVMFNGWRPIAYENRRGRFEPVKLGIVTRQPWTSAAWGDFNGDGRTDVHLVARRRSVVARNVGGRFRIAHSTGLAMGRASTWFDAENDGDLDLFVVQGQRDGWNRPDFLLLRAGGGFRRSASPKWAGTTLGDGDAVAAADSDGDGDTDIFVSNGHENQFDKTNPPELFRNQTTAGRSITLRLAGPRFNPWGMGARLKIRTGGKTYRREITDGMTYRAQSGVSLIHLGIGSAPGAWIKVMWPRGGTDCARAAAGSRITIVRGRGC